MAAWCEGNLGLTGKERRVTKRKKDELDLLLLAEAHPALRSAMPPKIVRQLQTDED
jgi:hypothetical protein